MGRSLGHSFSRQYFTDKFNNEHINASYSNFEINDISYLPQLLHDNPDIEGFNVTIPYKEAILPYLDCISEVASAVEAVNTVKVNRLEDGTCRLTGYNTDTIGFLKGLEDLLNKSQYTDYSQLHALILGTGGAAKAVAHVLDSLGTDYIFVSRNNKNKGLLYTDLTDEIIQYHNLIINCTPLGTSPDTDSCPPIPYEYINSNHLAYDLVYNPAETTFLHKFKEREAYTQNGMCMLRAQADAAWQIWSEQFT